MKMMKVSEGARVMMLVASGLWAVTSVMGADMMQCLKGTMTSLYGGGEGMPDIVATQQRAEWERQNTEWTLENQAKYPKAYCQAQLGELTKYAQQLDVQAHKCAVAKVRMERLIRDDECLLTSLTQFLDEAKLAYREADAENKWPVKLRGIRFAKAGVQTKILEAAQKIAPLKTRVAQRGQLLVKIVSCQERIAQEQQNVVRIRELVQSTLTDLDVRRVVEADQSISEAVRAIGDSLQALSTGGDGELSVEELLRLETNEVRQARFDAIMAE
jgi:hypothetical protein